MQGHALGVVHWVENVGEVANFLVKELRMPLLESYGESAYLDNGSFCLRLLSGTPSGARLTIDVAASNIEEVVDGLLLNRGIIQQGEPRWVSPTRKCVSLRAPYGFDLLVGREFDEDELGVTPVLHTNLIWSSTAIDKVQAIAREVPVAFRDSVRTRTVARAEELAVERGGLEVSPETALAGMIQVTPAIQLEILRKRLRAHGIDPEQFADDFLR